MLLSPILRHRPINLRQPAAILAFDLDRILETVCIGPLRPPTM